MQLSKLIPTAWKQVLKPATEDESFKKLENFLEQEWKNEQIFPPKENIFTALELTSFDQVKVVILGQDPYHDDNQAHGLSFSVPPGQKIPPSLRNILKELEADLGTRKPDSGYLEEWGKQGVLLLNTVLTVRAHQANSHAKKGWENFTDSVIKLLSDKSDPVVFVLWGASAQKKAELIDQTKNQIISSAHPSPLSAHRGFFGSRPFSKINSFLIENKKSPIDWQLPTTMLF